MTAKKTYQKSLCLFYILFLLLWSVCVGAASTAEAADIVCGAEDCYVNYSCGNSTSAIISAARHLPAQAYLSARDLGTTETLSAARNRSVRLLSRSVRQITAPLFSDTLSAGPRALSGTFLAREISPRNSFGIIITNYIHRQDGQK